MRLATFSPSIADEPIPPEKIAAKSQLENPAENSANESLQSEAENLPPDDSSEMHSKMAKAPLDSDAHVMLDDMCDGW